MISHNIEEPEHHINVQPSGIFTVAKVVLLMAHKYCFIFFIGMGSFISEKDISKFLIIYAINLA